MYNIEFSRKAAKYYQRADNIIIKRLNLAFTRLAEDPFQLYNIKKLSGELKGSYRLRLGDMRIIYSVDAEKNIVFIEDIGFRGDVYKSWLTASILAFNAWPQFHFSIPGACNKTSILN